MICDYGTTDSTAGLSWAVLACVHSTTCAPCTAWHQYRYSNINYDDAKTTHIIIKIIYRISSKSRRGGILFQGSVWCGDNSRAARFRGRRLQRSTRTRVHSFNNKPICMHVKCVCAYGNCCRSLTMRRDFEGGVYWDELADRCGDISRAAGFRGAARFRGNTVYTHHQWYVYCMTDKLSKFNEVNTFAYVALSTYPIKLQFL